jgi:hypothetical protein
VKNGKGKRTKKFSVREYDGKKVHTDIWGLRKKIRRKKGREIESGSMLCLTRKKTWKVR